MLPIKCVELHYIRIETSDGDGKNVNKSDSTLGLRLGEFGTRSVKVFVLIYTWCLTNIPF